MSRLVVLLTLVLVLCATGAQAVTIAPIELDTFASPCTLSLVENGSVRTLTWDAVSGAASYKVGYRHGGNIVALAEVTTQSYEHSGWSGSECLEYVLVACDGSGNKICAAHVPNVGTNCPE
jgi:hypothetical protein